MLIHVHHVVFAIKLSVGNHWQGLRHANGWYKNQCQQWQCQKAMNQTIQQKRPLDANPDESLPYQL